MFCILKIAIPHGGWGIRAKGHRGIRAWGIGAWGGVKMTLFESLVLVVPIYTEKLKGR